MRTLIRTAVLAAAVALAAPAAASAAGQVNTNVGGDVTYQGDAGTNVVTVTSTQASPTSATLVFSENGIAEGTDGANICTPSGNTVTCTFAFTQRALRLNGDADTDELTVNGPVPSTIAGDTGADKLTGGDGIDSLLGGGDADTLDGRDGDDTLDGGDGGDVESGGRGEDRTVFDLGDGDRIDLGPGRDTLFASNLDGTGDSLSGGEGADTLQFATLGNAGEAPFSTVDLERGVYSHGAFGVYPAGTDSLSSVENAGEFLGASGPDVLIGNARSNVLAGGNGGDKITGGAGTDSLLGDKSFAGVDQMSSFGSGADTINAFDGFEDQVECGSGADSAVADQFDAGLAPECETVDLRQADPFGIPPAPAPAPGPSTGSGGDTPGGQPTGPRQETADVRAPRCSQSALRAVKRAAFVRRGFTVTLDCDEPARVEATASLGANARKGAFALPPGDVVLGQKTLDHAAGKRRLAFRVPPSLRRGLRRRFVVRLRIDVADRAGNATTSFASFRVR